MIKTGVSIQIECEFFKIIYKQLDKEVGDEKKNHFEHKVFSSEARLEVTIEILLYYY